jgi:hypothetical protein
LNFDFFQGNVRSIYAVVDAPPIGGTLAVVNSVSINNLGQIIGVNVSNGGNYTGDADGKVRISITSLDGGSGGFIDLTLGNQTDIISAYNQFGTATRSITPGSGYPVDDFTLNKISRRFPSPGFSPTVSLSKGRVVIYNADYGTGVSHPKQVDL